MSALDELIRICKDDEILRQWASDAEQELARLQAIEKAARKYMEHDDNMNHSRYDALAAALGKE